MINYKYCRTRLKQIFNLLGKIFADNTEEILFIIPTGDLKGGGVMSICSIYEETQKIKNRNALVLLVNGLKDPVFTKFSGFNHEGMIYHIKDVVTLLKRPKKLIIHVPEYAFVAFMNKHLNVLHKWLGKIPEVQINILNQNIKMMPSADEVRKYSNEHIFLTMTAAHKKYATVELAKNYGMPLHLFSVFIDPKQYSKIKYQYKKDIIVVSPDGNPYRERILKKLESLKKYEVIIIRNMNYEYYKSLISQAKFSITFGEGLDGYFIEPVFSGGVSLAVYNEDFFTKEFKGLPGIFSSFEELEMSMESFFQAVENENEYDLISKKQFEVCAALYSEDQYKRNIKEYYQNEFNVYTMKNSITN